MMKQGKYLILLCGFLLIEFSLFAQTCKTIEQIIHECIGVNTDLVILKEKQKIQSKLYQNQLDKWKPNAKVDVTLPYSNSIESVLSGDGNVNYVKRNYVNPLLTISSSKKIVKTGGEIGITGSIGLFQNFINNNKQFNANWFNIYISQPLFSYNTFKYDQYKQRLLISVDSINYFRNKEVKISKIITLLLDYEIANQSKQYNQERIKQAQYTLTKAKTLFVNGRALADDTLMLSYSLSKLIFENEKLQEQLQIKKQALEIQLQKKYTYTLCNLNEIQILKLDTADLKQRYIQYSFQKELILDSFEVYENIQKMKRAHGINTSLSVGVGANQSSTTFNQIYSTPSQRQNISINTSIPITGWQLYKRNSEIALMEEKNYRRTKQDIEQNATQWVSEIYSAYTSLIKSYALTKQNINYLETLSNSFYKRYEMGKIPYTEYSNILNEIKTSQQNLLDINKQLYQIRFTIRERTLYDCYIQNHVFNTDL